MKKYIAISTVIFTLLVLPNTVSAEYGEVQKAKTTSGSKEGKSSESGSGGNQVQTQNEVTTQNMGEDHQLQVQTQEQESLQAGSAPSESSKKKSKVSNPRSENAREHMSVVATEVEKLLVAREEKGGIGKEVRLIAQQQKDAQTLIDFQLNKVESRKGLAKKIFGPDYTAVEGLKKEMEQNTLRIKMLQKLKVQTQNQADQTQLQETTQALINQNLALQDRVQSEEKTRSLLGWLFRFRVK